MDLIFSDDQLTDLTVAMVGAFPVIAVAFYAVRAGPDDLRSVSDDQKRKWVPDKWAEGWRWEFLQWVALTFRFGGAAEAFTSARRKCPLSR